jgi:hypothetical protein
MGGLGLKMETAMDEARRDFIDTTQTYAKSGRVWRRIAAISVWRLGESRETFRIRRKSGRTGALGMQPAAAARGSFRGDLPARF